MVLEKRFSHPNKHYNAYHDSRGYQAKSLPITLIKTWALPTSTIFFITSYLYRILLEGPGCQ